uniref:Uncharacterized protein n=1 Tax=Pristionchus pacificus TaxID=54126 RepID=A0A454Y5V7_PRIPA|eukprot:PDM64263.1 hypothetical protein PRIPAC_54507 [Pristionchus pacificus]
MKLLPTLLALLSFVLLVHSLGPTATTASGKITANLPGKPGEDPKEIQENIDRIQGEIKNLNVKVANLLSALNETNAIPFVRIDALMTQIQEQQTILNDVNTKITGLSTQINTKSADIKNMTGYVNCFTASGCGPESF